MDYQERDKLSKSWRGRRLLTCRAIGDLHCMIENLGVEENSDPIPDGFVSTITPELKEELMNQATVLLRTILLHNDGRVSPSRLQRF